MIFKTTVMNGMHAYTAYEGTSQKRAAEAMDAAKAVLLIARGTAWIYVGTPTHPNRLAWSVNEGSATPGPGAVWIGWRAEAREQAEAAVAEKAPVGTPALFFLDENGRENGQRLHFCSEVCRNEAERHLVVEGIAVDAGRDRLPHTGHCGTCGLPV